MDISQRNIQSTWEGFFFFLSQSLGMFLSGIVEINDHYGQFHCRTRQGRSHRSQDLGILQQHSVLQWGSSVNFRTRLWVSTAIWIDQADELLATARGSLSPHPRSAHTSIQLVSLCFPNITHPCFLPFWNYKFSWTRGSLDRRRKAGNSELIKKKIHSELTSVLEADKKRWDITGISTIRM